jgi:hypothetical protein
MRMIIYEIKHQTLALEMRNLIRISNLFCDYLASGIHRVSVIV